MTRRKHLQSIAHLGGLALKEKPAPDSPCACCGRLFKNWLAYIGHRGLITTAARYFEGDTSAAARQLCYNALAAQERGATWANVAWLRRYRPITAGGRLARLTEDLQHARLMADHGVNENVRTAARQAVKLIEIELAKLGE